MDAGIERKGAIGASTGAIQRQIDAENEALGANLAELERQAKESLDWRTYVRNHPLPVVGVAFGGGLLVATMTGARKSRPDIPRTRMPEDGLDAARERDLTSPAPNEPSAAHDAWEIFKGAVVGAATARAASYVSELFPEFSKHLEEQRRERAPHRKRWRLRAAGNGD